MSVKLAVVMDPISHIDFEKDGSLGLLFEAQKRGWELYYLEQKDLFLKDDVAWGNAHKLKVIQDPQRWFTFDETITQELYRFNVILMRKDPPIDNEYFFTTYLLENAEHRGALVFNKPQSLRDANEKICISWFPQCCPPTLVSRDKKLLIEFLEQQQEIVVKPLGAMGGTSVFYVHKADRNRNVIIETLTNNGQKHIMAQRFIPEVLEKGDKRIFMVNGEAMPYALIRIPAKDDFRGNIVIGAKGVGGELTERDRWICAQVGPELRKKGLLFVGLDVIGDYLSEINVTSPTGFRQILKFFNFDVAKKIIDRIEEKLTARHCEER